MALIPPCPVAEDIGSDDGVIIADEVDGKKEVIGAESVRSEVNVGDNEEEVVGVDDFRLKAETDDNEDRLMVGPCEVGTPSVIYELAS